MSAAVTLENLTLSYDRHPAVHHLSGRFEPGTLTALAGPNGAGKSTLLKAIAGIMKPDEGSIAITPPGPIAYLPQASEVQRDFPMSVHHLVATGAWQRAGGFRTITKDMRDRAAEALHAVGLCDFENNSLASLSTGQFQRALFARLLVQDAPLILLDEPFTAMDAHTTEALLALVEQWHKEGRTIICVLHDVTQIRAHFPNCLLLARECIAWGKTADVLPVHLSGVHFFHDHAAHSPVPCERAS